MNIAVPRPSTGDVVLTAALLVLAQATTWWRLDSADAFDGSRPANALLLALGILPLLWRRSRPVAVVALTTTVLCLPHALADLDVTVLGQFLPLIVATASAGYHASRRLAPLAVAIAVAGMLVVAWQTPFLRTPTSVVFNLVVLVAPWAAARGLQHREQRARRLGAMLAQQQGQVERQIAEAVERERGEIARDLHDIVAHGVSVMVVQIGGARMQSAGDPGAAARSLLQAEEAGRQALADLRRMLGVLRAAPSATASAGPRPGLAQLEALVEHAGHAGLRVETSVVGDVDDLPAAVDVSAYRIVQEALTNVLKHSRADAARLQLSVTGTGLTIDVRDRGPRRQDSGESGYGLVGIRERAAFLGGRTQVGPDGRGWRVSVEIPLTAPVTAAATVEATNA